MCLCCYHVSDRPCMRECGLNCSICLYLPILELAKSECVKLHRQGCMNMIENDLKTFHVKNYDSGLGTFRLIRENTEHFILTKNCNLSPIGLTCVFLWSCLARRGTRRNSVDSRTSGGHIILWKSHFWPRSLQKLVLATGLFSWRKARRYFNISILLPSREILWKVDGKTSHYLPPGNRLLCAMIFLDPATEFS